MTRGGGGGLRKFLGTQKGGSKGTSGNLFTLRWLDSLKNDDIHQKHEVFENIIFKTLEHL